ncbi:MAG TPA: site-2 protease family protein [Candidatus Limnocylindrales bacterium]|nr:site-2 protease family protein [Candidatus Limnocylindrales bacterium]
MQIYAADPNNWLDIAIILAFFLIVAFPVHEFFHAYMAYRLGDGTARMFGKLTLNPIAHFHPIGGWMLVFSTLLFGIPRGFAATPVNPSNLRGRHGDAYVAAAGPLSNFLLAAVFAIPYRILLETGVPAGFDIVYQILFIIVFYDIVLGFFNLIPVWPLDGGTILLSYLPYRTAWQLRQFFSQFGMLILVVLIFFAGRFVLLPLSETVFRVLVG